MNISYLRLAAISALVCAGGVRLSAQANAFECTANTANPILVRDNGVAELVSEYILNCDGGVAGQMVNANFVMTFNTGVTSKMPAGQPEALVLIGEPAPRDQVPGVNVIQATASGNNQLAFSNVSFPQAGPGQFITLRFTNLRVNVSALAVDQQVVAFLNDTSQQALIVNPQQTIAFVQPALASRLRTPQDGFFGGAPLSQCTPVNPGLAQSPAAAGGIVTFNVQFSEASPSAFLPRLNVTSAPWTPDSSRTPGFPRSGETGFYNPAFPAAGGLNVAGLASQGTRLMAKFAGIPPGVSLFVTVTPSPFGTSAGSPAALPQVGLAGARLTAADANGAGPYTSVDPSSTVILNGAAVGIAPLAMVNGAATAVWEILQSDLNSLEDVSFGVLVAYSAPPPAGAIQVTRTLAPLTTDFTAASNIVPRFTNAVASADALTIAACGAPLPDLQVSGIAAPTQAAAGSPMLVSGTVLNNSATPVAAPFEVGYSLYQDSALTQPVPSNTPATCQRPGLAANTSALCLATLGVPGQLPPGTYYIGALADDLGKIPESNEANNTASVPLTVTACQFSLTPPSISIGRGASIQSVFVNAGNGCSWTHTSLSPWLTITSAPSSAACFGPLSCGPGTVTFAAASNPGPLPRFGGLTIAGRSLAVTQAGVATPSQIRVYRSGSWYADINGSHGWEGAPADQIFSFGVSGDIPLMGDWDGTGQKRLGIYRDGSWYVDLNGTNGWDGTGAGDAIYSFGVAGDVPILGDWDGTGKLRLGIYRAGLWYVDLNGNHQWDGTSAGDAIFSFGVPGDIPVVGDWDGSGRMRIGIYRAGLWYADMNGNNQWDGVNGGDAIFSFGVPGDIPVVGDWDGSGQLKIGIYRNGLWFVDMNGNHQWDGTAAGDAIFLFGVPGDLPVAATR